MRPGTLYVVATPLGNLGDLSARAAEVLRTVPLVAAEDTRRTRGLLTHLGVAPSILSFHAHSDPHRLESLLEILGRSTRDEDKLARNRADVQKMLNDARMQGYATAVRPRRVTDEISMAVPIMIDDRVLAAVSIRFSGTAVPLKMAVDRFLPKLRETAQKIRQTFVDQQREMPPAGARPGAAAAR